MADLYNKLNEILGGIKLDDVTSEKSGDYPTLPEGYFLMEVVEAKLTVSKNSGNPMASFRLKCVEDGVDATFDNDEVTLKPLPKTKGITAFKHFVLKDETSVKRFVSDMLKFEESEDEPYLPKEAFTTGEVLEESIESLEGMNIYIQNSITENDDGTSSNWINFISWKRAKDLGLPTEG